MRKLFIGILAVALVVGMSMGVMADNEADVEQVNTDKELEAFVEQNGYSNLADILQIAGQDSYADVLQEGDDNEAEITQTGSNIYGWKEANIIQTGDNNLSEIVQDYRNALGEIMQDGNRNEATMSQNNNKPNHQESGWGATGFINQFGNDNLASITQDINLYQMWSESGAEILQFGDSNEGSINQVGGKNEAIILQGAFQGGEEYSLADFGQEKSNSNMASIDQDGEMNFAGTSQWGDNNEVDLEQYGDNNTFEAFQIGDGNKIKGVGKTEDGLVFSDKPAKQFGEATFWGVQDGDNNKIGFRQGQGDTASVTQVGDENEALLYQFSGKEHDATIGQSGEGSFAEVIQN